MGRREGEEPQMDPAGAGQARMNTNGEGNGIFPQIAQIIADL